jgi:subtilisin family serine protease
MGDTLRRTVVSLFAALTLILGVLPATAETPTAEELSVPQDALEAILDAKQEATYLVWMADDPIATYDGGISGYAATRPARGEKVNPNSRAYQRYEQYLDGTHDDALDRAGADGAKMYDYSVVFNGFAAELTAVQAAALAGDPDVLYIFENEKLELQTSTTPDFLGLTDDGGAWDLGYVGEDVIIGVVDSGVWPENPAFSDRTATNNGGQGRLTYRQIPGWHGKCTPGDDFPASDCNQKLIGAQYYGAGYGGEDGVKAALPYEFWSARDADGHGSHTASTAGGNANVAASASGFDLGAVSGMAPRARIAAYKACWGFGDDPAAGCFTVDTVAAIDQAVADGVDVINYSISGTRTNFLDAVEVAFLFAADAGVFVAASAGNSGPTSATVAHPSPWITTVAAGTHDRFVAGTVTLGDGTSYEGASLGGEASGDLVYAGDAGDSLCNPGNLDPAVVSGKIVVCDRGAIARVAKSAAVAEAGGVGMIHANTSPSSINADLHAVPTVHVDHIDGAVIRAYAQTAGATATLSGGDLQTAEAPDVASFSSRGPLQASSDLLKPDIMAPGQDVLAAVSPIGNGGDDFSFYSGTSMSSPHIAGLAAVVTQAHPDWTPAMIKSALMTTSSTQTNVGNPIAGGPFDYGSGHVVPNSALDPGLVYDAGFLDYFGFLCGTGQLVSGACGALEIDPSDLNQPNITIGELAGTQTVTRTVTNVGPAATYDVSVDAPAGIDVAVSPSSLTLGEGESASYEVTFTTTGSAAIGSYAFGELTWSHGPHNVRSTLTARPVQLAAPVELNAAGDSGSLSYDVDFGYSGPFTAAPHGLIPATKTDGSVVDDPANDINVALGTGVGVTFEVVVVPAGTAYTRVGLFDDYTDGNDDLDLYVFGPQSAGFPFQGGSGSPTSAEEVNLVLPDPGVYLVAVHGWGTDGPDANYTLFDWSVSATPADGSEVTDLGVSGPTEAVLGTSGTINASWSGLAADTKYLGAVSYTDTSLFGLTVVAVSTD